MLDRRAPDLDPAAVEAGRCNYMKTPCPARASLEAALADARASLERHEADWEKERASIWEHHEEQVAQLRSELAEARASLEHERRAYTVALDAAVARAENAERCLRAIAHNDNAWAGDKARTFLHPS